MAATYGHIAVDPSSHLPLIGASGAIAAVMGAFLIRLYSTRIKFFFFIWFIPGLWGTFLAPAWIMLPLWLLMNVAFGLISNYLGGMGVAYWAHVGGFAFGAVIALAVKFSGLEDKYLAPAIEKKIGVFKQHTKVISGIEKLDKGKTEAALADFKAALRENPQDIDAKQQLAEVYKRKNQIDLAQQELKDLLRLHMRKNQGDLAAHTYMELKSLNPQWAPEANDAFAIAQNLEKQGYFNEALGEYYNLYKTNPTGSLAVRSLLRCGNILAEKTGQPEHALQAYEAAQALAGNNPIWSSQIQEGLAKAKAKLIQPAPAGVEVIGVAPLSVSPSPAEEAAPSVYYQGGYGETEMGATMAEEAINRARQIQAHRVKVTALYAEGIQVLTKDGRQGIFAWDKIKGFFVGKVMPPPPQKGVYLFMDIILGKAETPEVLEVRSMRINGAELPYRDLIEDPQPQGAVNFKKFTAKVVNLCPEAVALPNSQSILGNPFREYKDIEAYEADLGLWVERKF